MNILIKTNSSNVKYIPNLDVLRAFAVILVLIEHWLPQDSIAHFLPNGVMGVTLFFVLSGYLITQILLSSRKKFNSNEDSPWFTFKSFYIRRALRIFPIYYLALVILLIFNFQDIRNYFTWFLFYGGNIYFYKEQISTSGIAHLWTLAVEEQFYLIYPFIILLIPKRYILRTIYFFIFMGIFSRVFFLIFGKYTGYFHYFTYLTPTCFDSFGLGALLAYLNLNGKTIDFKSNLIQLIIATSFFLFCISLIIESELNLIWQRFFISILSVFIISKAILGFDSFLPQKVFQNKTLLFIGKVSYGIYLYHNFIRLSYSQLNQWAVSNNYRVPFFKIILFPEFSNVYLNIVIYIIILTILVLASWYLIEKPVNSMKTFFPYNKK